MGRIVMCASCKKTPDEIGYAGFRSPNQSDEDYVKAEEGTYDPASGFFLCDVCYIFHGQPSSGTGWKATQENLFRLGIPTF